MALFEVSWEVCNKVGGIHTVISSKAPFIAERIHPYFLVGPIVGLNDPAFEPRDIPVDLVAVADACRNRGVKCTYGKWLIPGEPNVFLLDTQDLIPRRDALKHALWERYGIDSLHARWDFDEPMLFATGAGILAEEYARQRGDEKVTLHAHEWMAGFAILHLKMTGLQVRTVFTTHATMLGRSIAGSGEPLYTLLPLLDAREWAYRLNVQEKHLCEVACAKECDVFTTVSDITGMECERILGRKPDVLLYNGFHAQKFPTFEETSVRHSQVRDELREMVAYAFFPHYTFDMEKTLLLFTSGRYEFANKGMDVLIEALSHLDREMRGTDRTVVVFFWVMRDRGNISPGILESKNFYHHVKSYVRWQSAPLLQRLSLDILAGKRPGSDTMLTDLVQRIHSEARHFRPIGGPPMTTHQVDESTDPVIRLCRERGLLNTKENRVKVLLFPGMLDGSDGLLNLPYYDATIGCHLGVFPSAYEPWGYTPLESAALGIPTITTDQSGFGSYLKKTRPQTDKGVLILQREEKDRAQVIMDLARTLKLFVELDHYERVQHGIAAKSISAGCDWQDFIIHYLEAYDRAWQT